MPACAGSKAEKSVHNSFFKNSLSTFYVISSKFSYELKRNRSFLEGEGAIEKTCPCLREKNEKNAQRT